MTTCGRIFRALIALVLTACVACPPARALVTLNEGHDRIYVTGNVGVSYDSNVYAANGSPDDYIATAGYTIDYQRRAGWIGVNASLAMSFGRFATLSELDFQDPTFMLELTKQSGRTTGSVTLNLARESRADAALNTRTTSWNYQTALNYRYHISGAYDLSGQFGYTSRDYVDESGFTDLETFNANVDLYRVFTSERDLVFGYRYRFTETSRDTASADHEFSTGLHGKIFKGFNGNLRIGYMARTPEGGPPGRQTFTTWTASGAASYAINKKFSLGGQIAKDFATTASDTSVDTTSASLDAQYALSSRWSFSSGVGFGDSRFLGLGGRIVVDPGPPLILGPQRHDNYLSWTNTAGYSLNEHLRMSLTYVWFQNWSNVEAADFIRRSWNFNLSSRW